MGCVLLAGTCGAGVNLLPVDYASDNVGGFLGWEMGGAVGWSADGAKLK